MHLDVRNVFLQNLPEEVLDHCFLIDIVSEYNKGESGILAMLATAKETMDCCFKSETNELGM